MPHTHTLYDLLEVSPQASPQVIRAVFRCLTQSQHPDKQAGSAMASERQAQINAAYAVLSDPVRRKHYDQHLASQPGWIERRAASLGASTPPTAGGKNGEAPRSRPFAFRPLP